MSFVIAAPEF
ncbi:PE-PGRS family protein [Mycobacterium tuberculosis variant bovis BCG str. Pasteur 1173P2]|uniref:PE-PGRS family protein n=1 Tax=Mycobacterium bovis (strain BCG / Pasteur 1173P2) TaxID=410289 RepID=A0A0H3MG87_MYCBP|nr:PE-PGRS family protein [Mycobacterium tuberculosis variant bovis BCG str. Mexico]BAH27030.1 PE-PGRS family protein [Mycobacterium tuberculosis variant bovis BCG str. Tokyo 172]CAL72743.1 PE-PGRS family protein [Mycobacterium tuberculosis variant bovis BCG str. Pasteur 1173P2]CCC65331.1 PE-PGRS family protein [Mycobacterium tuberculosis variant bovis BCG str. Moreau RDJ]